MVAIRTRLRKAWYNNITIASSPFSFDVAFILHSINEALGY